MMPELAGNRWIAASNWSSSRGSVISQMRGTGFRNGWQAGMTAAIARDHA
jgi:hypothetical protein